MFTVRITIMRQVAHTFFPSDAKVAYTSRATIVTRSFETLAEADAWREEMEWLNAS